MVTWAVLAMLITAAPIFAWRLSVRKEKPGRGEKPAQGEKQAQGEAADTAVTATATTAVGAAGAAGDTVTWGRADGGGSADTVVAEAVAPDTRPLPAHAPAPAADQTVEQRAAGPAPAADQTVEQRADAPAPAADQAVDQAADPAFTAEQTLQIALGGRHT